MLGVDSILDIHCREARADNAHCVGIDWFSLI